MDIPVPTSSLVKSKNIIIITAKLWPKWQAKPEDNN